MLAVHHIVVQVREVAAVASAAHHTTAQAVVVLVVHHIVVQDKEVAALENAAHPTTAPVAVVCVALLMIALVVAVYVAHLTIVQAVNRLCH